MGSSLFRDFIVGHHSSYAQFVSRPICAEEIFTLQLSPPAVGTGINHSPPMLVSND